MLKIHFKPENDVVTVKEEKEEDGKERKRRVIKKRMGIKKMKKNQMK